MTVTLIRLKDLEKTVAIGTKLRGSPVFIRLEESDFEETWNIFRNQKDLSRELLLKLAKKQGWDADAFEQCMNAPETKALVEKDIEAGDKIYVTGTPTVLVNNRRVKYWTNPDVFRAILREEIARSR